MIAITAAALDAVKANLDLDDDVEFKIAAYLPYLAPGDDLDDEGYANVCEDPANPTTSEWIFILQSHLGLVW